MTEMSNEEVLTELRSTSTLNRARIALVEGMAEMEQGMLQRKPIGPVEMRRLEFQIIQRIQKILNEL